MHFSIAACAAALVGMASAQNVHVVSVGSTNGSLIFSPDNIKANPGEMIQFQFRGGNHSVVQSNFDNPCVPISESVGGNTTGMFSGYMPVAASEAMGMIPTYTIMVTDAKPMWLYCSQGKHCQNGMVMVVNENPGANVSRTLTQFKSLAAQATANLAPSTGTSTGGSTGSGSGSTNSGTDTSTGGSTSTSDAASSSSSAAATAGAPSTLAIESSMGLLSAVAAAALFLL
ncbi:hypothetical protein F5X96DRAFT_560048 [Biscogniauxia mediterranea]|nr:hypothetical protein F5X96DRAFT_560048 [Biscogniauxia mediterranea]